MDASTSQIVVVVIGAVQSLVGALIGGGMVLLGGRLTDRRKDASEHRERVQRARALMAGLFAVRNHIASCLVHYEANRGLLSGLRPLRTAAVYIERLIEKTPPESEALMVAIIDMGLKLDSVLDTMDRRETDPSLKDPINFARVMTREIDDLKGALEQFDIVALPSKVELIGEEVSGLPSKTISSTPPSRS